MLQYRDFVPQLTKRPGIFSPGEIQSLASALAAANAWIEQESIQVVNVETVVLPNLWEEESESSDPEMVTSGMQGTHWYQFIRVWYRS
jgi:hypothetical protein